MTSSCISGHSFLSQAANPLGQPWVTPLIPRGDLQTTFLFKGFDDVRRLGLRACIEKEVRESKPFVNTTEGAEGECVTARIS